MLKVFLKLTMLKLNLVLAKSILVWVYKILLLNNSIYLLTFYRNSNSSNNNNNHLICIKTSLF